MASGRRAGASCVTGAWAMPLRTRRSTATAPAKRVKEGEGDMRRSSADFDDVVREWSSNFLEPVWDTPRDDHDRARRELTRIATLDRGATYFARRRRLWRHHRAAGRECRRSTQDVNHVGIEL